MTPVEELEHLVRRLDSGNQKEQVCEEARQFLASVEPTALREAERQLMEKGVPVEKLNKLCAIHLELYEKEDDPDESAFAVSGSDIVDVLYHEHEIILDLLEELEGIGHMFQSQEIDGFRSRELVRLPNLIDSLLNIESHLRREEEVIFAELEHAKKRCSAKVLAAEHRHIHDELAGLAELVGTSTTDLERFRQKAASSINVIVPVWWRHIFKENNLLFPAFLEDITDERHLIELKSLCDKIGYAGFEISVTPRR